MAYAQMPQFVSIHGPKIGCNELSMATITEVLQSEPVKRLLHRQNVYLQSPSASSSRSPDLILPKHSSSNPSDKGTIVDSKPSVRKPELSVIPIMSVSSSQAPNNQEQDQDQQEDQLSSIEDKHLLPSKYEGKSGVALLPIARERRRCGHYEPCETVICDVDVQELPESENSSSPLIAVGISPSEIDAPVSKHCASDCCDALSIDHDRCRRAIIRCHRCDVQRTCDICLVVLKTRKSRMNHRNCRMRIEYRHNRTSRAQILRDRMRQRELEILESARIKRSDYADPITGHERVMESLQNNSELIVIPKTSLPVQQHPTIRIASVTGASITPTPPNAEIFGQFFPRFPLVFPQQAVKLLGKNGEEGLTNKQTALGAPSGFGISQAPSGNPRNSSFVTVTRMPRNFVKPVNISNLLQSTSQPNTSAMSNNVQNSPFLLPVRVVQTQGIPKYCLVPDLGSGQTPGNFVNATSKILLPPRIKTELGANALKENPGKNETRNMNEQQVLKRFKPGMRRGRRKKTGPKRGSKSFECSFCFKRFSTDWYFKLHIAKHKGEIKFTCKFCKKPFMHLYNMTKHVVTMHKKESDAGESISEENLVAEKLDEDQEQQSLSCVNCNLSFESTADIENHPCCVICLRCNSRLIDGNLMIHLKNKHGMNDQDAVEEYERHKREGGLAGKSRTRTKRELEEENNEELQQGEIDCDQTRSFREEIIQDRENGISKRRRHSGSINQQNPRRITRRRNNSHGGNCDNVSPNQNQVLDEITTLNNDDDDHDDDDDDDDDLADLDMSGLEPVIGLPASFEETVTADVGPR